MSPNARTPRVAIAVLLLAAGAVPGQTVSVDPARADGEEVFPTLRAAAEHALARDPTPVNVINIMVDRLDEGRQVVCRVGAGERELTINGDGDGNGKPCVVVVDGDTPAPGFGPPLVGVGFQVAGGARLTVRDVTVVPRFIAAGAIVGDADGRKGPRGSGGIVVDDWPGERDGYDATFTRVTVVAGRQDGTPADTTRDETQRTTRWKRGISFLDTHPDGKSTVRLVDFTAANNEIGIYFHNDGDEVSLDGRCVVRHNPMYGVIGWTFNNSVVRFAGSPDKRVLIESNGRCAGCQFQADDGGRAVIGSVRNVDFLRNGFGGSAGPALGIYPGSQGTIRGPIEGCRFVLDDHVAACGVQAAHGHSPEGLLIRDCTFETPRPVCVDLRGVGEPGPKLTLDQCTLVPTRPFVPAAFRLGGTSVDVKVTRSFLPTGGPKRFFFVARGGEHRIVLDEETRQSRSDAEPPALAWREPTPKQRDILAELDAHWWGWRSGPSPISPTPKSWQRLGDTWVLPQQEAVAILLGPEPSPQEAYIAEMLRRELVLKHRLPARVVSKPDSVGSAQVVVVLGTLTSNPQMAGLCALREIADAAPARPESYAIDFVDRPDAPRRTVLVVGGDAIGCVHGGYSLMQLLTAMDGALGLEPVSVRDYPTVPQRSLRGVGESLGMKLQRVAWSSFLNRRVTPTEIHDDELMLPCLDWLARNRINWFQLLAGLVHDAKLPERLPHMVDEAHRRGIKVVGGFRPVGGGEGGRTHPCYCSEADVEKVLGFYRQYIDAGCDAIYYMADDYEPSRLAGHCARCIQRFGGLAGEQQFMLHRIIELARAEGLTDDQVLFCPTHYDRNPGEDYLDVFDADPKLRRILFTFTYTTRKVIEERKETFPNLRYALFYNGPRWLSYYFRKPPATAAALAKYARQSLYFPIYFGWHAASYAPESGWFVNTGDDVRRDFHEVIPRETPLLLGNIANYTDSIFKGPVEYALWGHYCWSPATHDTRQSEVVIGDAVFGPGGGRAMGKLNLLLVHLTRLFFKDVPVSDAFREQLPDSLALAAMLHQRLLSVYERHCERTAEGAIPSVHDFGARQALADLAWIMHGLFGARRGHRRPCAGRRHGVEPLCRPRRNGTNWGADVLAVSHGPTEAGSVVANTDACIIQARGLHRPVRAVCKGARVDVGVNAPDDATPH